MAKWKLQYGLCHACLALVLSLTVSLWRAKYWSTREKRWEKNLTQETVSCLFLFCFFTVTMMLTSFFATLLLLGDVTLNFSSWKLCVTHCVVMIYGSEWIVHSCTVAFSFCITSALTLTNCSAVNSLQCAHVLARALKNHNEGLAMNTTVKC